MKPASELVRERRKRKGWSQTVLGDMVGMSAATIHRIEHGEKIPTDQEVKLIAGMLGINHEELLLAFEEARANHNSHPPKSAYKTQWDTAHPASYAGRVWIQVYPANETCQQPHEFTLEWGQWRYSGTLTFADGQPYVYLLHYKHNDGLGLPLFLTLSHPCYVVFGKGEAPQGSPTMDINRGWQRTELPPPGQLWRYTRHFILWYLRYLLRRP